METCYESWVKGRKDESKSSRQFFSKNELSQDLIRRSDFILPESVQVCRLYQINWRENERKDECVEENAGFSSKYGISFSKYVANRY